MKSGIGTYVEVSDEPWAGGGFWRQERSEEWPQNNGRAE